MGKKEQFPPQQQEPQPGVESQMSPKPKEEKAGHQGAGKLRGKVALITGGDSGIGRAVAIAFAKEGADVAIVYLNEHADAKETKEKVEAEGRRCVAIALDIGTESACREVVSRTVQDLGRLDILVNNAAVQHPQKSLEDISAEQLERTFRTNIFAQFYMTKAALPHFKEGSAIINTTSVTAYRGSPSLLDYSSTKGAIVAFTRSLALSLAEKKIRVNGGRPRADLDPADPLDIPRGKGGDVWLRRAAQAGRPARGGRPMLCIPGLGRCLLHDGTGSASQWRRNY